MNYSAVIFAVCALFALASARSVVEESPNELSFPKSEDEKRFFFPQISAAVFALGQLQAAVSGVCIANVLNFQGLIKRACDCIQSVDGLSGIFGLFGDEIPAKGTSLTNKRDFIGDFFNVVKKATNDFCDSQFMREEKRLDHLCQCLTGKIRGY